LADKIVGNQDQSLHFGDPEKDSSEPKGSIMRSKSWSIAFLLQADETLSQLIQDLNQLNRLCKFGVSTLLLASCWAAHAADPSPIEPSAVGHRIGTVWLIAGDVLADGGAGKLRHLAKNDVVYVGERLRSAGDGEAVLKLDDAGILAIRPRTDAVMENFVAEGKPSDHQTVHLFTGTLRLITGYIGKLHPAGDRVVTSNATLGIRGTDYEPFVLSSDDPSAATYSPGSYDKVNRGMTTVEITNDPEHVIDVPAGKVGFAPASNASTDATRGLLTLLLPRILDTVPNFYLPGRFDDQIDAYSEHADAAIEQQLASNGSKVVSCDASAIATQWLDSFDKAEMAQQTASIVALFAPDAKIRAVIRDASGQFTTVSVDRREFASSVTASVTSVTEFSQERSGLDASVLGAIGQCHEVRVTSSIVEQGKLNGKPYKTRSVESYTLELRDGKWLAVDAQTKQD
jgi:hypothetical protein